jgi:hypothetical protein
MSVIYNDLIPTSEFNIVKQPLSSPILQRNLMCMTNLKPYLQQNNSELLKKLNFMYDTKSGNPPQSLSRSEYEGYCQSLLHTKTPTPKALIPVFIPVLWLGFQMNLLGMHNDLILSTCKRIKEIVEPYSQEYAWQVVKTHYNEYIAMIVATLNNNNTTKNN